jgi:hypothetical protein
VFELLRLRLRQMRRSLFLVQQGVAGITVLADDAPVFADVVAIVAAEAAGKIHVPDIVGMSFPVHLHLRKYRGVVNALQLSYGRTDSIGLG